MKKLFVLAAMLAVLPLWAGPASAAPGDLVGTVTFSQDCGSGIGTGIAYDGAGHLWVSCYSSNPDLLRTSATTGVVDQTYNIAGGLGGLAYDATRNALWAGWGDGTCCAVRLITLDPTKTVIGSAVRFDAVAAQVCGLNDGLGYDATDDTLYISDDCSVTIWHYSATDPGPVGTPLGSIPWSGSGCFNSGVAIGGDLLFQGSDGCSHVWVVDKTTLAPAFDFSTVVPGDPNFRDEGLTCDTETFAPTQVMWSKEAYSPNRAAAFEIPADTCGIGGQPPVREGCSPGYWKNHLDSWADTGYSPDQTVASVGFVGSGRDSMKLSQALALKGGSTIQGAKDILLRAAVAALLNAADPNVSYPLTVAQVLAEVNAAFASNDRQTILDEATRLDEFNNLGCPKS